METVTLIIPLEATNVKNPSDRRSDSRSDHRGDSRNESSGSGAKTERKRTDNGAISEQQRIDRRETAEVTVE